MQVSVDLGPETRYRVFAHVGNLLSEDGVTVIANISGAGDVVFDFGARDDAVTFFRHMASAAAETTASEEDEEIPGAALMVEHVTIPWDTHSACTETAVDGERERYGGAAN